MKKKYFLFAGIIWLALAGLALYFYSEPHRNTAHINADVSISAVDLYSQYQKNENDGNKKFLNKVIEVSGKIADVQQTATVINVQLEGGSPMGGVNCSIAITEDNKIALPAKNEIVTIKGRCSGFLMDVNLVDCVLEKSPSQ